MQGCPVQVGALKAGTQVVPPGRQRVWACAGAWLPAGSEGPGRVLPSGREGSPPGAVAKSWASVLSVAPFRPPEEEIQVPLVQDLVPEGQEQDTRVSCLAGCRTLAYGLGRAGTVGWTWTTLCGIQVASIKKLTMWPGFRLPFARVLLGGLA